MQVNLTRAELLSDTGSFTDEQRKARETFIDQELVLPRQWLREDGWGVDAGAPSRVAPRFAHWGTRDMASSFADLLKNGGDAFLWALIRIGLEETPSEDLAELCESRGFIVRLPRRAGVQ